MAWVLAAALLVWTVFGPSPAGKLLTGVATVGLVVFAVFGTVARPRLVADDTGIAVRQLSGSRRWAWDAVRVRVFRTKRFGRQTALLELDTVDEEGNEHLVVLGWLDLGTEPDQVADALRTLRQR